MPMHCEIGLNVIDHVALVGRQIDPKLIAREVQILSATLSEQAGHWYVSLQVEEEQAVPENTGPVVGIDLGIKQLATLSDGEVIANPRHRRAAAEETQAPPADGEPAKQGRQEPEESRQKARSTPSTDEASTKQHPASGHHQAGENQAGAGDRGPERQRHAQEPPSSASHRRCGFL
jgi:hypothetical protein